MFAQDENEINTEDMQQGNNPFEQKEEETPGTCEETDKKIFTNTAKKTKTVNVKPKNSRGGIRF